jgi:hypothetical protein
MTPYQHEQRQALEMVRNYISGLSDVELKILKEMISDYMFFRRDVDRFLDTHFSRLCTRTCYQDQTSACCSKDGIITFFADAVINALESSESQLGSLMNRLTGPHKGSKCVYLGSNGCLWQIKPLVCAMFLCTRAEKEVLDKNTRAKERWAALKQREKSFRWPDREVLFETIEDIFIKAGYDSTLMYLHKSPGLLRVKAMRDG